MKYIFTLALILIGHLTFSQSSAKCKIGMSTAEVEKALQNGGQDLASTKLKDVDQVTYYTTEQILGKDVKASFVIQDGSLAMILKSYPAKAGESDKAGVKTLAKAYVEDLKANFGEGQEMNLRNIKVWRWQLNDKGYTVVVAHENESVTLTESDHAFSDDVLLMMDNYENMSKNLPIEYKEFKASKIKPGMTYAELVANYGEPDKALVVEKGAALVYDNYIVALEDGVVVKVMETTDKK